MSTTTPKRPSGKSICNLVLGAAAGAVGFLMPNIWKVDDILMILGTGTFVYYGKGILDYVNYKLPVEEPKRSIEEKSAEAELEEYLNR